MLKIFAAFLLVLSVSFTIAQPQYKFDNTVYKALFLNQAFQLMSGNSNYVIIDVRTPGEYADTSLYTHMNMGKLKGAINIEIDSFQQHINELKQYSDKNIFLICSHSQRSRRVSKLLGENGFKNVYNINGGMTLVNELDETIFPGKKTIFEGNDAFTNIASNRAIKLLQTPGITIIDVREKTAFDSKDSSLQNNIGRIKNALNIPYSQFEKQFRSLQLAKEKPILVYDNDGGNSADAALAIHNWGYQKVYHLFEGLAGLNTDNYVDRTILDQFIENKPPYQFISAREMIGQLKGKDHWIVIDTRPTAEYENKADKSWLNIGYLQNAINVTSIEQLPTLINGIDKNTHFLVYGSFSNLNINICNELRAKQFKNIYFTYYSLNHFLWSVNNIEDCKEGAKMLVKHEGIY